MYCILSKPYALYPDFEYQIKSGQQHASERVILLYWVSKAFGGKFCLQLYRQGFLVVNLPAPIPLPALFIEHPCCIFT
jgi:hypothetical protein